MSKKLEDKTIKDFLGENKIPLHDIRSLSFSILTQKGEFEYARHYDQQAIDLNRKLRVYADGSFEDKISVTTDEGSTTISTGLRGKFLREVTELTD